MDIGVSEIANHVAAVTSILSRRDLLSSIGARYDMDHLKGYQITADVAAIAEIAASPLVFDPGVLQFSVLLWCLAKCRLFSVLTNCFHFIIWYTRDYSRMTDTTLSN